MALEECLSLLQQAPTLRPAPSINGRMAQVARMRTRIEKSVEFVNQESFLALRWKAYKSGKAVPQVCINTYVLMGSTSAESQHSTSQGDMAPLSVLSAIRLANILDWLNIDASELMDNLTTSHIPTQMVE